MAPTAESHEAQPTQAPALVTERPLGYRDVPEVRRNSLRPNAFVAARMGRWAFD